MNHKRNLAAIILGSILFLSACSDEQADAANATPSAVLDEYIEYLNEGEVEAALSLVTDTGDLDPSSVQTFEGVISEQPQLADSTEITDEMTSVELSYTFGSESHPVNVFFRKDEDGWKLSEPLYLTGIHGEQTEVVDTLQSAGYAFTTLEGQSVLEDEKTHVYLPTTADPVQMTFDVQDTKFFEPFTWSFWLDPTGEIRRTVPEEERTGELNEKPEKFTDAMKTQLEQHAVYEYEQDQGESYINVVGLTPDRGCEPLQHGGVDVALLEAGVEPLKPVEVLCHVRSESIATTDTYNTEGQPVTAGEVVHTYDDQSITGTIELTGDVTWH
jgi:hypothetical protein